MTQKRLTRALAAGGVALGLLAAAGCSEARTDTTQQAIRYESGISRPEVFKECQSVPDVTYGGANDYVYYYPLAQRTFAFTDDDNAKPDTGPISVTTKNGQEVIVRGLVTFTLTSDCGKLQLFHERIGKRERADFPAGAQEDDDGGWPSFLGKYFTNPLNLVMDTAGSEWDWQELYDDETIQPKFEKKVFDLLAAEINSKIGEGVIIVNAVDIQRPQPAGALIEGRQKKEAAKVEGDAAVERVAQQRRLQAEQLKLARDQKRVADECLKTYSEQTCFLRELAAADKLKDYHPGIMVRGE